MILCCKTCGEHFEGSSTSIPCTYCGKEVEILISDKELSSLPENDLIFTIQTLKEKYHTKSNPAYNQSLWENREYKWKTETEFLNQAIEDEKIASHMVTTGISFERYHVTAYHGICTGEYVLGTGFFSSFEAGVSDMFGVESTEFAAKLEQAKQHALKKLIRKSIALGGNATLGVDFDYIMFTNNLIGISANGTSISIEKDNLY